MKLTLTVTFKPAFTGGKNVYAKAVDWKNNLQSNYVQQGTWFGSAPVAPTPVSATPSGGTGLTQTFSFRFSDPGGAGLITGAAMLFNTSPNFFKGCDIWWGGGGLQLSDGVTSTAFTPLGTAARLDSTFCSVDLSTATAVGSVTDLTITLTVTFKPGFVGAKNLYSKGVDWKNNLQSPYIQQGTWTIE